MMSASDIVIRSVLRCIPSPCAGRARRPDHGPLAQTAGQPDVAVSEARLEALASVRELRPMAVLIGAAVEALDDALAAIAGGADRLELCADLNAGGTTPTRAL